MKKNTFRILIVAMIAILTFSSCSSTNSAVNCNTSNSDFSQLYNQLATTNNNFDEISEDVEEHSYTFEVTSQKNICSIGYQSVAAVGSAPYHIEIFNNTTNTLEYSGDHIFSTTATSYVSVGSISLNPGNSYTIKRIPTNNPGTDVSYLIGRVLLTTNQSGFAFPHPLGDLILTNSMTPSALPYIDIVFEQ